MRNRINRIIQSAGFWVLFAAVIVVLIITVTGHNNIMDGLVNVEQSSYKVETQISQVNESIDESIPLSLKNIENKVDTCIDAMETRLQTLENSLADKYQAIEEKVNNFISLNEDSKEEHKDPGNVYSFIHMNSDTRYLFDWVVALEATDQPEVGIKGVAEVICNRAEELKDSDNCILKVLTEPGQFAAYHELQRYLNGERPDIWAYPSEKYSKCIDYVLEHGRTILPEGYIYFATSKVNGRDFIQIQDHYFSRK